MDNWIFYIIAVILTAISFIKDKKKTLMALKKGMKGLNNILPQFLGLITAIGIIIAILNPSLISKIIGESSGWIGVILAAIVGAITIIPAFVAFPTSAMLIEHGAGYMQISAFVSSLMMVGIMTYSLEAKFLGKKVALTRNLLSFAFVFVVALIIGMVM